MTRESKRGLSGLWERPLQWQGPVQWEESLQWEGPLQWEESLQWEGPLQWERLQPRWGSRLKPLLRGRAVCFATR